MESEATDSCKTKPSGLTRLEIFELLKTNSNAASAEFFQIIEKHMLSKLQCSEFTLTDDCKAILKSLKSKFKERWQSSQRLETRFLNKNQTWLQVLVPLHKQEEKERTKRKSDSDTPETPTSFGRPPSDFDKSSDRSKRRKVQDLRRNTTTKELGYATQMNLREEGKIDAAHTIKNVVFGSPSTSTKYRQSIKLQHVEHKNLTPNESVSVYIDLKFSGNKFQQLRNVCLARSCKMFPSVKKLRKARRECHPIGKMDITHYSEEIKLQPLLHHTVQRIIESQTDVIARLSEEQLQNITLVGKWGMDGSCGHSIYKQELDDDKTDANLFFTAFVPLQLFYENPSTAEKVIVWKNARPSSPRYCRPIKMQFAKETDQLVKETRDNVSKQIDELQPYSSSMIDEKVCNSLTECKSAQRCFVCSESISHFNDLEKMLKVPVGDSMLKFGISSLHAWIRCFECLLQISYKLDIRCWKLQKNN